MNGIRRPIRPLTHDGACIIITNCGHYLLLACSYIQLTTYISLVYSVYIISDLCDSLFTFLYYLLQLSAVYIIIVLVYSLCSIIQEEKECTQGSRIIPTVMTTVYTPASRLDSEKSSYYCTPKGSSSSPWRNSSARGPSLQQQLMMMSRVSSCALWSRALLLLPAVVAVVCRAYYSG